MTSPVLWQAKHMAVGLDESGSRNLPDGTITDGASVRFIKKTAIHTGPGYRRTCTIGGGAKVDDLFGSSMQTFKTLWGKTGTRIAHNLQNDDAPYTVGLTLTAAQRQAFLEVRNGDLLTFNQVDSPSRIAVSTVSAINSGAGTFSVRVGDGGKFISGTVYIRGIAVTGGTLSTDSYSGCSGLTAAMAVGDLVTQTSQPSSFALGKGTCGMFMDGSTLIAGIKGREDVIYTSAPATFDNPEYAYDLAGHGASAKVMQNPVVAMIKGSSLGYIFGTNWCESTPGFDLETGILQSFPVSPVHGAYNARCVVNMGGRAAMLGEGRFIPIDIKLDPQGNPVGKPDDTFDGPIRPWLESFDPSSEQVDAALVQYDVFRGLVSITGSVNGAIETKLFDSRKGVEAFLPKEIRPMRCHVFFDGNSYFGSNSVDKVFQNHVTLTNNGFPILHKWRTGWLESFAKTGKKGKQQVLLDYLAFNGYMSEANEFTVNIYRDGNTDTPVYSIDLDDSLITSSSGIALGTRNVGVNLLGGGGEAVTLAYRFQADIDLNGIEGESFMIEFVCAKLGGFLQQEDFIMEGQGIRLTNQDRA